mmetsp:Transcript_10454/g.29316  ORF Transcript_10454/g.29316 Transcript_10454/m.29316 type:complete len:125 (+) Transcript_10454:76-450(+)
MSDAEGLKSELMKQYFRRRQSHWEHNLKFRGDGSATFTMRYRSVHGPKGPTTFVKTFTGDYVVDETARTVTISNVILSEKSGTTDTGSDPTVLHVSADGRRISGKFGPNNVDIQASDGPFRKAL